MCNFPRNRHSIVEKRILFTTPTSVILFNNDDNNNGNGNDDNGNSYKDDSYNDDNDNDNDNGYQQIHVTWLFSVKYYVKYCLFNIKKIFSWIA